MEDTCGQIVTTAVGGGSGMFPSSIDCKFSEQLTRERYLELSKIAMEVVTLVEKKGVAHSEGCIVRQIAERLWELPCKVKKGKKK